MKKINIKKYIYDNKIRSTLFILKATKHGGIPDGTKKTIRKMRNRVGNIRFILLSEKIPQIKETFDLVITDGVGSALVERVKKIVKFNRLLVIYKGHIFDTNYNNGYKSIEIPLTHVNDLNRVHELQRQRKKQTYAQLAGKKAGHYVGVALVAAILLLPSLIVAIILGQYNPAAKFDLEIGTNKSEKVQYGKKYSALSYNTGFTAYNQNMHFYMDCPGQQVIGGQGTSESKEATMASLAGIKRILTDQKHDTGEIGKEIIDSTEDVKTYELKGSRIYTTEYDVEEGHINQRIEGSDKYVSQDEIENFNKSLNDFYGKGKGDGLFDFVALQEQDIDCPKSFNTNQPQIIKDAIVKRDNTEYKWSDVYNSTFALNFSTPFIPIPLNDMFGKTVGGLSTFSKYYNCRAQRYELANIKTFPLNLFEMKRCLSMNQFPIGNAEDPKDQKYFYFINAHLAAYDSGGNIRREQLGQLNEWLTEMDKNGDYYIVAADWNQVLPDTRGYEGNDAFRSEQTADFDKDKAIMAWDFEEFKSSTGNTKSPNLETDFVHPETYDSSKTYKAGDVVSYEYKGTAPASFNDLKPITTYKEGDVEKTIPGHNGPLTQYMASVYKHDYQALVDTNKPPVDENGNKNPEWRYSLSNNAVYRDASLNDYIRSSLLPIAYYENAKDVADTSRYYLAYANFYTTHAIPTLRNAGEQYRNEAENANLIDPSTGKLYENSHGYTYKASIDGFLVSHNIRVHQTFGFDTNYKYSDHNPVGITFEFVQ